MRLVSFSAKKLNHIERIEIPFNESLNFITGVNGSGKTSVLNAIIGLISPNFEILGSLNYQSIEIKFQDNDKVNGSIVAEKEGDGNVSLRVNGVDGSIKFSSYEDELYSVEDDENRRRYYSSISTANVDNPVMQAISNTPTPMFLGLDRRHAGGLGLRRIAARSFARRRKRNIFSSSLGDSLRQATTLAEDKYHQVRSSSARYSAEFVRELLLSLLEVPEQNLFAIEPPTATDRKLIEDARKALTKFPSVQGISADDIRSRLDPKLKNIIEIVSKIPQDFDFEKTTLRKKKEKEALDSTIKWMALRPTLGQITKIASLISQYNARLSRSSREIDRYIRLIDDFFSQTGKGLGFDESGRIQVRSANAEFSIEDLSSGEAQLFVLLTHLSFNPYATQAGVVVIDEPEVSLHLLWQEMLTSSMMAANSSLQYILATHSPSIIAENVDCAIDISQSVI